MTPLQSPPGSRVVRIYGPIDEPNSIQAVEQLLRLDNQSVAPIRLYLFSPGGSVHAGFAILDTVRHLRSPVYTIGFGLVASMASLLLAVGSRGHRYLLPNTRVMIHPARGETAGQPAEIESGYQLFQSVSEDIERILAEATGKPRTTITAALAKAAYLSAEEAVSLGLADTVLFPDDNRTTIH